MPQKWMPPIQPFGPSRVYITTEEACCKAENRTGPLENGKDRVYLSFGGILGSMSG